MIDPEELTFMQLFWLILGLIILAVFICRWVDLYYEMPHEHKVLHVRGVTPLT